MRYPKYMQNVLIGAAAVVLVGSHFVPSAQQSGPVLTAATAIVTGHAPDSTATVATPANSGLALLAQNAVTALNRVVRPLSNPNALNDAFTSYFAYKAEHPNEIKKPYLYFVDYGLASTEPRGYVFDMDSLKVVDGPFTVAHGRGSSTSQYGVPTKFSNASNSYMTSLGLYVTQGTYAFTGHSGGSLYSSIGLRLNGVSGRFNDRALARGVVVHGAPYVTSSGSGRSLGCPAMEQDRAHRLIPKIANGGLVFLFSPNDAQWMNSDPWAA